MKKVITILLLLLVSCSAQNLIPGRDYDAITAMSAKGELLMVSVSNINYSYSSGEYDDFYFYYDEQWHLGKDWFNTIEFPFRTVKQQDRFVKKYNKKISNPKILMLKKH